MATGLVVVEFDCHYSIAHPRIPPTRRKRHRDIFYTSGVCFVCFVSIFVAMATRSVVVKFDWHHFITCPGGIFTFHTRPDVICHFATPTAVRLANRLCIFIMQYFINHSQAERWTAERRGLWRIESIGLAERLAGHFCVNGDFHNEKMRLNYAALPEIKLIVWLNMT